MARDEEKFEHPCVPCYLTRTMKKLILLLSVVAVSFALQAGENACPNDKAACDKSKAAACDKTKATSCDKAKSGCPAQAEAKNCCPAGGAAKETAKQPVKSPKDSKKS
jgi:hypothetical protein